MGSSKRQSLAIKGDLRLDRKGKKFLGGARIDLLESIERLGSITHAAKAVGLSYKAAWDAVDAMNNLADRALVLRATGGAHGGGSRLTNDGNRVVRLYRLLESGYQRLTQRMQEEMQDLDGLNELLRAIAMKTSARNQLRGKIKTVRKGAVNADVILDLGDSLEIFANITNEAVEDLGLKPGRDAYALIKASFVLLSPDLNIRISARNRLPGTITDILVGSVNCEIKMQLTGTRTLTATITKDALQELGLTKGSRCCALIKASHVLVAIND
jgi:molybdate transport system regulatory protein